MLAERVFEVGEDGRVTTSGASGVTPGLDPAAWLLEVQPKRTHWWPASVGGGARGKGYGSGSAWDKNPWTRQHWNLTAQGQVYAADPERAAQMARSAGSEIGARKPPL